MARPTVDELEARIHELEDEVKEREADLATYREELKNANRRLERLIGDLNLELKAAHQIQRLLIPTELPNIPGFEFSSKFVPSMKKGGDYFDIFEHDDRSRFGIVVASSSGHMMSALLLSVLLKLSGQIEARRGAAPNELVKILSKEILEQIESKDSADLLFASFDRRSFQFSHCKVGEILALRFDYAASELKLLKGSKDPIKVGRVGDFESESIGLNPRDKLIFCTRGLIEAKSLEGEEYGVDRLFRTIHEMAGRSVHELRNHVLYQIQKFTSGQEPPRDMTLVIAEVKDRVIKLAKN